MLNFVAECQTIRKKIELVNPSLDSLRQSLTDAFDFKLSNFTLEYLDCEGELTELVDKLDFDYFLSVSQEKTVVLTVKSSEVLSLPADDEESSSMHILRPEEQLINNFLTDGKSAPAIDDKEATESSLQLLNECLNGSQVLTQLKDKLESARLQAEKMFAEVKDEIVKNKRKNSGIECREIISNVVHSMIVCANCGLNPINGKRYKCVVCNDYNLCEVCEENDFHSHHPMLRIVEPTIEAYCSELAEIIKLALTGLSTKDPIVKKRLLKAIFRDFLSDESIEAIIHARSNKNADELAEEFYKLLK